MRLVITALVLLIGVAMAGLALSFMFSPLSVASVVAVEPGNAHTLSTLRGDFAGFFGIIGITMVWGAWKRSGDLLLVPAIIMLVVIAGRLIGLATDGGFEGVGGIIAVEALIAAILFWARSLLPHHAVQDVGD